MKFSEIEQSNWEELQPYLDTCLLPLTGLSGEEAPWQVTESLEKLRDLMDFVENPFKGRVITYPAIQYSTEDDQLISTVNELCLKLKKDQFKYVILISADASIGKLEFAACDLMISSDIIKEEVSDTKVLIFNRIQQLWK
jgi:23S rRNA (pseudouridine1915-N3)-methyltransferase